MRKLLALLMVVMLLAVYGCGASTSMKDAVNAGNINGRVYSNELLKFSMTMPEGWRLDDAQATLSGHLERLEGLYGSEVADQMAADIDAQNLGLLLYSQENTDDEQVGNILVQISNTSDLGGATLEEYADQLGEEITVTYSGLGADMDINETTVTSVGGHDVALTSASVDLSALGDEFAGFEIGQAYSLFEIDDYIIVAMMSTFSSEDFEKGMAALNSISFS